MHPARKVTIIGCGYIGSALARRLVAERSSGPGVGRVVGTTSTPARLPTIEALGIEACLLDLADVASIVSAIESTQVVFFLAAPGRGRGADGYRAVFTEGLQNVGQALESSGVEQVVFTSSTAVYGQTDGSWVDEDSPVEPRTETGLILRDAERSFLDGCRARDGCCGTVLRLAGIYGPDRGPQRRLESVAGRERSDGDAYLNLVHRDDVVAALLALLETPHDGILSLADDSPTPRRQYYDSRLREAGLPPSDWVESAGPPNRGRRVSNTRIKKVLGLRLRHPSV